MSKTCWMRTGVAGLLLACGAMSQSAACQEPDLSAAETAVVARRIATLKGPVDRHVAQGWSNSKKVAELICRPAALPVVKKQAKGADKVFLGTDAPETLTLESNSRLTGTGQFRTPQGWQDFRFTCDVNPKTGKVTNFQTAPLPAKPH